MAQMTRPGPAGVRAANSVVCDGVPVSMTGAATGSWTGV